MPNSQQTPVDRGTIPLDQGAISEKRPLENNENGNLNEPNLPNKRQQTSGAKSNDTQTEQILTGGENLQGGLEGQGNDNPAINPALLTQNIHVSENGNDQNNMEQNGNNPQHGSNGYSFVVPRTKDIASLQNLSDHELRVALGQLNFNSANKSQLLFGVKRLLPSVQCLHCQDFGKWSLNRDRQSFRCIRAIRNPDTLKEQPCGNQLPILEASRLMLKLDSITLRHDSLGARYLVTGIWETPNKKPSQPTLQNTKSSSYMLSGLDLSKQLSHLFSKYDLPSEVEHTMRQMHSRLLELEAQNPKSTPPPAPKAKSYAEVASNQPTTHTRPSIQKKSQKQENQKMVNFLAQAESESDKKLAAYRIMTGRNPATNTPIGKPRPVIQRMVKLTSDIQNQKFLDSLSKHQILHVTGVKRIYIDVIRTTLQNQGLDLSKIIHLTFFDNNTLQLIVERTYSPNVIKFFRDLPQEDGLLSVIVDPKFPQPEMELDDEDPEFLKSQHDFVLKMALSCTRNRTLLGATLLQQTIPLKY